MEARVAALRVIQDVLDGTARRVEELRRAWPPAEADFLLKRARHAEGDAARNVGRDAERLRERGDGEVTQVRPVHGGTSLPVPSRPGRYARTARTARLCSHGCGIQPEAVIQQNVSAAEIPTVYTAAVARKRLCNAAASRPTVANTLTA